MNFTGVTYGNVGEGLFTGYLQEQKWFKDSCIPKAQPSMGDGSWTPASVRLVGERLFQQAALPQSL